jgi:hypothetical protein
LTRTRLPTIAVYAYEAERESIPSHRSTRSEPVHGTKMIYTPDKRPPSHHESTSTRRLLNQQHSNNTNSYNASGVLDVLRLQKQEENKRTRPDFSGMWKWKKTHTDDEKSSEREEAFVNEQQPQHQGQRQGQQSTKSSQIGQKVNQVKKMHELYRQNVEGGFPSASSNGTSLIDQLTSTNTSTSTSSPRTNMQLSPIRHRSHAAHAHSPYQKPQTPVVRDKILSTDDYHTVSKYFKLRSPKPPQSSLPPPSSPGPGILPAISPLRNLSSPLPSDHPSSTSSSSVPQFKDLANDPDTSPSLNVENMEDDDQDPFSLSADHSLLRPNSPDGLLTWCATLNTDFIDDLY